MLQPREGLAGWCGINFVTFVNFNDSHCAEEGWGPASVFINRQKSPIQPTTKRILNIYASII